MLTGGAAAEIHAGDEDGSLGEARVVERVVGFFTGLGIESSGVKREFAESVEGDAFHEASRDDAVGIDVRAGDEYSAAGDEGNWIECHGSDDSKGWRLGDSGGGFEFKQLAGIGDVAVDGGGGDHDG